MNSVNQQFLTPDAIRDYARKLDPNGDAGCKVKLRDLKVTDLFDDAILNHDMAACCQSGLWLLHNFLQESHDISQSIHSTEGSWWHAIMHRSEGDFSNAKYWYRRVGEHEAFSNIETNFDPIAFVDQCQHDYRDGNLSDQTQETAFAEWKALFDFCHQNAT